MTRRDLMKDAAGRFFRASEQPFFLQVNFPDAHFPLLRQQFGLPRKPHEPDEVKPLPWVGVDTPRLREFTANYYSCLARLDAGVGMVLDELQGSGKAANTLVIYIGDHGAQFSRGKTSVYEGGLRIPFLVCWPQRLKAGAVPSELVSEVDILPTICEATGIALPRLLAGRSLLSLARGEPQPDWRQTMVGFTAGGAPGIYYPQWSIRDRRYKLIHSPLRDRPNTNAQCYLNHYNPFYKAGVTQAELATAAPTMRTVYATYEHPPPYELYDLENDPYEFTNLAEDPAHAELKSRLAAALKAWQERTDDPLRRPAALRQFTAEHDALLSRNYRKDASFRWHYLDYLRTTHP